jgi:hypothetical protein
MGIGGVDGDCADPRPGCCGHLVAHQREQGGDEDSRTGAALPEEQGRHEVHGRLAPPRALHDEGTSAVVDERLDRFELAIVELRVIPPDESAQDGEGGGAAVGHCSSLTGAGERWRWTCRYERSSSTLGVVEEKPIRSSTGTNGPKFSPETPGHGRSTAQKGSSCGNETPLRRHRHPAPHQR